jgi:asparagine synthase (glutamine-hydrolysing)
MPTYGSNDGALVLPLNNCDFTDYRPLLQLGSYITKKQFFFEPGPWDEDIFWLCGEKPLSLDHYSHGKSVREQGASSFPGGGTHLLRAANSKVILRCTNHRARPSHADQLHMDLWIRGQNIACDAGTYLYSGEDIWRNGLAHTSVHNTVIVDHLDQMKMLTRFTWTNWSHGEVLRHEENVWQGEHDGYKRLPDPANHKRTVISLNNDRWLVVDHMTATQAHHYALQWLLCDGDYGVQGLAPGYGLWLKPSDGLPSDSKILLRLGLTQDNGKFSVVRADSHSTRGWRSQYYGDKEPAISVMLEAEQAKAVFWTFFGFESDVMAAEGHILKINSQEINLEQLNKQATPKA